MKELTVIHSTIRDKTGKSSVKKLHSQGLIPAVVYGRNFAALPLSVNTSEIKKIFKPGHHNTGEYQLFNLFFDNQPGSKNTMAMVKEIQWHPVTGDIVHIDFFAVKMDEKVIATIQIRLTGKPEGVKFGGILRQILRKIEVKSLPSDIPPHLELDVSKLQIGDSLHVEDLNISENIQVHSDPDSPVVTILSPTVQEEEKGEEEEAEEGEVETTEKPSSETETKE